MIEKIQKINKIALALLLLILIVATYCFIENFLFSSFDLLSLREIDDVAFHSSLASIHKEITNLHFDKLFRMNDYGYGWIFWLPLAILTFPLYLLNLHFGIEWPLIVLPRQVSLLFSFATLYVLYKSLSLYTKDEFTKAAAVLLYMSSPVFALYAIKFHPTAQVNFLSCLTFYLVAKEEYINRKSLKQIAIALALTAATKLNGLLIAPLIAMLLASRLNWKFSKENIKSGLFFVAIFVCAFLFFSNPSLIFAVFRPEIFENWLSSIQNAVNLGKSNYGGQFSVVNNFIDGIAKSNFNIAIFFTLFGLFLVKIVIDLKKTNSFQKFDFLCIFLSLIFVAGYLSSSVKLGCTYVASYYGVICFLMVFSLVIFGEFDQKVKFLSFLIFLINLSLNFNLIVKRNGSSNIFSYNVFYKMAESSEVKAQISLQKEMQKIVGSPSDYPQGISIVQDYQAPAIYSNFRENVTVYYLFDNINTMPNNDYDFILLSKKSKALLTQKEFLESINSSDDEIRKGYIAARNIIENILLRGIFRNVKYKVILSNNDIILLQRVKKI